MWQWVCVNASLLIYPSPIKYTSCYLLNREMDAQMFDAWYFVYYMHHAGYQYSRPCVGAQRARSSEWPQLYSWGSDRHPAQRTHSPELQLQFGHQGDKGKSPPLCLCPSQQANYRVCLRPPFPQWDDPHRGFLGVIRVSELGRWMIEYWNYLQRSTCIFKSIHFMYFLKASFFKFKNTSLLKNANHHLTMQFPQTFNL